jgi:hypothetical protein
MFCSRCGKASTWAFSGFGLWCRCGRGMPDRCCPLLPAAGVAASLLCRILQTSQDEALREVMSQAGNRGEVEMNAEPTE